jgi:aryl-alcohol dehydrogenase-like predicted oxidoreductase
MAKKLDNYRLLGRSGLRVSPLALGTMTFAAAGFGGTDNDAAAMVDLYVDRGGNFIDTANFYGGMGGAERLLGKLIAGRRDRLVISTKYSLSTCPGDPNAAGNHRKNMVRSVEDSLARMRTDYIDLLYLHMWDFRTPVDEILRAFDDLVRQGKILYAGLSDTPAWQAARMQAIAEQRGWTQFAALQISYSLIERTVEHELMPMAREMGMGVCPWSPLAGGVLSGKYTKADLALATGTMDRKAINVMTGRITERTLAIADVVQSVAREMGRTPAQVALAWTMLHPAVTAPVLGARTPAQLEDNLAALEIDLSPDHIVCLNEASALAPIFPMSVLRSASEPVMFGRVKVEERD